MTPIDLPATDPALPDPAPDTHLLAGLPGADRTTLDRLHERLAAAADADRVLDLGYTTVDSPLGPLLLAGTEQGLVRVAFACEDHDRVLDLLGRRIGPRILRNPKRLDSAARELAEYFAGRRTSFDLPLDLRLAAGFRRSVLEQLCRIGYGTTATYAAVAAAAGHPRAIRAAGTACARNPLPLVVPCHRVVRSDGTVGQYAGGSAAKKTLLALEAR